MTGVLAAVGQSGAQQLETGVQHCGMQAIVVHGEVRRHRNPSDRLSVPAPEALDTSERWTECDSDRSQPFVVLRAAHLLGATRARILDLPAVRLGSGAYPHTATGVQAPAARCRGVRAEDLEQRTAVRPARDDDLHGTPALFRDVQRFVDHRVLDDGPIAGERVGCRGERHLEIHGRRQHEHVVNAVIGEVRQPFEANLRLEEDLAARRLESWPQQRVAAGRRLGRTRQYRPASRALGVLDPVALPLERIRRQGDRPAPVRAVETRPVDLHAPHVQLGHRLQ